MSDVAAKITAKMTIKVRTNHQELFQISTTNQRGNKMVSLCLVLYPYPTILNGHKSAIIVIIILSSTTIIYDFGV